LKSLSPRGLAAPGALASAISLLFLILLSGAGTGFCKSATSTLTFCCRPDNDLYLALGAYKFSRFTNALVAVQRAPKNSAVLVLADRYPEQTTSIGSETLDLAREKGLRLYIEYASNLPGLVSPSPRVANWERLVVSSDKFQSSVGGGGPSLEPMRILMAHSCHYLLFTNQSGADLTLARVAGYDTAIYGLPAQDAWPILFSLPGQKIIVGATKLSGFVRGRYAPSEDWKFLWENLLHRLGASATVKLSFSPTVSTAYSAKSKLPRRFERQTLTAAANWFANSHLLVHPQEKDLIHAALASNTETIDAPCFDAPEGDGSLGIMEGYASAIRPDGSQPRRLPLRADCNAESAMVLALDSTLEVRKPGPAAIAGNLLDFVYFNSGMCAGVRADPGSSAYGLIGWGDVASAWLVANYGDDDARAILATLLASAALNTHRYDERVMRALLANLRTTGELGFRTDRIDLSALQQNGWASFYHGKPIDYSPHFESYLWACYLWSYQQTNFRPFLDRTLTAISMTMKVYPDQWRWQDNLERAHMLLCLAWLVRVEDTVEHREWLRRVATDLLKDQTPSGAILERLGSPRGGHYRTPQKNADYGTAETPLLQENGDPVTDQLYTTGFALLGLHEAAGATGDPLYQRAEDRLAEFLCRIQTRSAKLPYLSGTWFRAFDDRRWEAWASSADVGWGAWCLESGWGQAWIPATLALREKQTTMWEMTSGSHAARYLPELKAQMLSEQ
jgi:hypothetical protein